MNRTVFILLVAVATAVLVRQGILSRQGPPDRPEQVSISVSRPATDDIVARGRAIISKRSDGYFWAKARIGGHYVDFIVDTGAQLVALTPDDAARINIDIGPDPEKVDVITASGRTQAHRVLIPLIVIDTVRLRNVEALVMEEEMANSLLGMSFFGRISGWEAGGDTLVIRQ